MARPIKTLKEAIVSKISNNGSDVSVDDNLDLQSSNEIKNATAVSTEKSQIGTVSGAGNTFRLIERRVPIADTSSIQFSGLSDDVEYRMFLSTVHSTSGGIVGLRLNGDGNATGNYFYYDATATKQTSENEFLIADNANAYRLGGTVGVTTPRFGTEERQGINHEIMPGGLPGRLSDFGREGGRDVAESLSSIELFADGDFKSDQTVVELWERDYS